MAIGRGARGVKPVVNVGGGSGKYDAVEPGYYLAAVEAAAEAEFQAAFKCAKGRFTYIKVTPDLTLLNPQSTKITRQDIVFGAIDKDGFYFRPDGNQDKPALFMEASFFLSALGFVDADNAVLLEEFAPDLVCGQVIRVKVENDTYEDKNGDIKKKNVIKSWFAVRAEDVDAYSLHYDEDSGMVFINEQKARIFHEIREALLDEAEFGGQPF